MSFDAFISFSTSFLSFELSSDSGFGCPCYQFEIESGLLFFLPGEQVAMVDRPDPKIGGRLTRPSDEGDAEMFVLPWDPAAVAGADAEETLRRYADFVKVLVFELTAVQQQVTEKLDRWPIVPAEAEIEILRSLPESARPWNRRPRHF